MPGYTRNCHSPESVFSALFGCDRNLVDRQRFHTAWHGNIDGLDQWRGDLPVRENQEFVAGFAHRELLIDGFAVQRVAD